MRSTIKTLTLAAVAAVAVCSQAHATLISPVSVVASSQLTSLSRGAVNAINQSGQTGNTVDNNPSNMWENTGNGTLGGGVDATPFITFNLGSLFSLTSALVWNYNESGLCNFIACTTRGVNTLSVSTSTDGVTFTPGVSETLSQGFGTLFLGPNVFSLSGTGQYIRFSNLVDFGDPDGFVGLSEVQFNVNSIVQGVPEPASLALLGVGLVGLGALRRRANA